MTRNFVLPGILMLTLLCSCSDNEPQSRETVPAEAARMVENQVEQTRKVLVSKGVVKSENIVRIYSRIEGQLEDVNLLEGTAVTKGSALFRLDDSELKAKVELSESEYEQAVFKMDEILVGQGYKRDSLEFAPAKIREYARIKSGVNVRKRELDINRDRLARTIVRTPVSGVVTGVNVQSFAFVKPGETLCTVIDPKKLIIEFSVLETEMRRFSIGSEVEFYAIAYSDILHTAVVRSLGSVVDESGMVKVEATVAETDSLLPGMTVIVNM